MILSSRSCGGKLTCLLFMARCYCAILASRRWSGVVGERDVEMLKHGFRAGRRKVMLLEKYLIGYSCKRKAVSGGGVMPLMQWFDICRAQRTIPKDGWHIEATLREDIQTFNIAVCMWNQQSEAPRQSRPRLLSIRKSNPDLLPLRLNHLCLQ